MYVLSIDAHWVVEFHYFKLKITYRTLYTLFLTQLLITADTQLAGNALAWVQLVHKPADLWDITFCTRRILTDQFLD